MLPAITEARQDPRIKRTRALLHQAFLDVVSERGFQSVSVQDIAARAGVNRATFYSHFSDKYALLDFSVRQRFREELEARTLSACHFSHDNLRALIVTVCQFVESVRPQCRNIEPQYDSLMETQVKNQVRELLIVWLSRLETARDPEIAATAASWAIYGLALQWSRDKKRPSAESFAETVLPIIAANLGDGAIVGVNDAARQ